MTRQEALAHVLNLATNKIECPYGLSELPEYKEVVVDMPRHYYREFRDWLEDNDFIKEII